MSTTTPISYLGQAAVVATVGREKFTLTSGYTSMNTCFVRVADGATVGATPMVMKDRNGGTRIHHVKGCGHVYRAHEGWLWTSTKGGMRGWTAPVSVGEGQWAMFMAYEGDELRMSYVHDGEEPRGWAMRVNISLEGDVMFIRRADAKDSYERKSLGYYLHEGRVVEVMAVPFKGLRCMMSVLFQSYGVFAGLRALGVQHEAKELVDGRVYMTLGSKSYLVDASGSLGLVTIGYEELVEEQFVTMYGYKPSELVVSTDGFEEECSYSDNFVVYTLYNKHICINYQLSKKNDVWVVGQSVTVCSEDEAYSKADHLGLITLPTFEKEMAELRAKVEARVREYEHAAAVKAASIMLTEDDKAALVAAFGTDCKWDDLRGNNGYVKLYGNNYCSMSTVKDDSKHVYSVVYERGCCYNFSEYDGEVLKSFADGKYGIAILRDASDAPVLVCHDVILALVREYLSCVDVTWVEVGRDLVDRTGEVDAEGEPIWALKADAPAEMREIPFVCRANYRYVDRPRGIGSYHVSVRVETGSVQHDVCRLYDPNLVWRVEDVSSLRALMLDMDVQWSKVIGESSSTDSKHGYARGNYYTIEVIEGSIVVCKEVARNSSVKMSGDWYTRFVACIEEDGTVLGMGDPIIPVRASRRASRRGRN